jgi:hypothetical protein
MKFNVRPLIAHLPSQVRILRDVPLLAPQGFATGRALAIGDSAAQIRPTVTNPAPVMQTAVSATTVSATELARQRQQLISLGLQPDDPNLKTKLAALFATRNQAIQTAARARNGLVVLPKVAVPTQQMVDAQEARIAALTSNTKTLLGVNARSISLASNFRVPATAMPAGIIELRNVPKTILKLAPAPVQPTITAILVNGQLVPSGQPPVVNPGDTVEMRGTNFLGGNENVQPTLTLNWARPVGGYPTPPPTAIAVDYLSSDQTDLIFVVPPVYLDQLQEAASLTMQVGQATVAANLMYNAPSQTNSYTHCVNYMRVQDVLGSGNDASHLFTNGPIFSENVNALTAYYRNSERYTIFPNFLGGQGDSNIDSFDMPTPAPGTGAYSIAITYIQNPGDSGDTSPTQVPNEAYAFLSSIPLVAYNGSAGGAAYGFAPIQGGVLMNQQFYLTTSISFPSGRIWAGWGFSAQNGILYDLTYSIVVPAHAPHAKVFQGNIPGF